MIGITYVAEVAWTTKLTGVWTVGTSKVGGTDVVSGSFGDYTYNDLSADLEQATISRGRVDDLSAMGMGALKLVLRDLTGKYNPKNTAGPLYGLLTPYRPIRLRALYAGTYYPLYWGFIETIEHDPDPNVRQSYITAVDLLDRLAACCPIIASTGAITTGAAIGLILDARGWTQPSMRLLDAGHGIPDFSADGTKTGLQLISDLLLADQGTFYIRGDGVARYMSVSTRYARQSAVASLTGAMVSGARPGTTIRRVLNSQTVTRIGGAAQTVTDAPSVAAYDVRQGSAITSPYLLSDSVANNLAAWLVLTRKDPRPPVRQLQLLNKDAANAVQVLAREVGDYVTAVVDRAGNTVSGWIEQVNHSIAPGPIHSVSYVIGEKTSTMFTVGQSVVGGGDRIGY
jgi:hypothetical protein